MPQKLAAGSTFWAEPSPLETLDSRSIRQQCRWQCDTCKCRVYNHLQQYGWPVDFIPGWTGRGVGSFAAGAWEAALTGGGNFTFDGAAIDATSFADNFFVSGDGTTLTMAALPPEAVGDISITTLPGGDVEVSWNGIAGHSYAVEYKNNLVTDSSWLVYTNGVSGTGEITVTVDVVDPETFYQVTGESD